MVASQTPAGCRISLAAAAERPASLRTSSATTEKPLPMSPDWQERGLDSIWEFRMAYVNNELDRALAVAAALVVRPDRRCFCRLSPASALREITPRVAQALRLAREAAPHLQRHVLLARKMSRARELGAPEVGSLTRNIGQEALAAIDDQLRTGIEALREDLRLSPPTAEEREVLEAAAFGSFPD